MYERAFFIVNIVNILICAFLIISLKRCNWIAEMIFEDITIMFIIPLMFFLTNVTINIIFGVPLINWILTFAILLIPGLRILKESIEQKRTFRLYDKYEDIIKDLVNNSLHELKINVDKEDIKIFLTNKKEIFSKGKEDDSCHVVVWLNKEQKSQTNSELNRNIESELELAIKKMDFNINFKEKRENV